MPLHQKGAHTIDCPPLFRCREHKKALSFSEEFCEELMDYAQDRIPDNLSDTYRQHLGQRLAYNLPQGLSNPKIILFNPEQIQGVDALPFVTARINNRFIAIPARYLDADRFEGCPDCVAQAPGPPPPLQEPIPPIKASSTGKRSRPHRSGDPRRRTSRHASTMRRQPPGGNGMPRPTPRKGVSRPPEGAPRRGETASNKQPPKPPPGMQSSPKAPPKPPPGKRPPGATDSARKRPPAPTDSAKRPPSPPAAAGGKPRPPGSSGPPNKPPSKAPPGAPQAIESGKYRTSNPAETGKNRLSQTAEHTRKGPPPQKRRTEGGRAETPRDGSPPRNPRASTSKNPRSGPPPPKSSPRPKPQ